jgi:hypothetical protein
LKFSPIALRAIYDTRRRAHRALACKDLHFTGQRLHRFSDARFTRVHVVLHTRRAFPFCGVAVYHLSDWRRDCSYGRPILNAEFVGNWRGTLLEDRRRRHRRAIRAGFTEQRSALCCRFLPVCSTRYPYINL